MSRTHLAMALAALCAVSGPVPVVNAGTEGEELVHVGRGCIIYPLREVVVSSQASGIIVEMPVEEQEAVEAGQLIARLDDRAVALAVDRLQLAVSEEHTLREAEIRLEQALDDFEAAKKLKGTISESELIAERSDML